MGDETSRRGGSRTIREYSPPARGDIGQNAAELYEFGPFRLEPSERKLWRNNESVALTPGGFRSADEIAQLPGARRIDEGGLVPGPSSDVYAFYRGTACTAFQFRESLVEARRRGI